VVSGFLSVFLLFFQQFVMKLKAKSKLDAKMTSESI